MLFAIARTFAVALFASSVCAFGTRDELDVDPTLLLERSSLSLDDRYGGGIADLGGISRLVLSYDWNEQTYRAVAPTGRQRGLSVPVQVAPRVAKLSATQFLALMDRVRELGLLSLPLEQPTGSEDLYHRNVVVEFQHRGRSWRNGFPTGCELGHSKVQPTTDERERFDSVIAFLAGKLASLPMQDGSIADLSVMEFKGDGQLSAYRSVVQFMKDRPEREELDFNRCVISAIDGDSSRFDIAWRESQHPASQPTTWPGMYSVLVKGKQASFERAIRPKSATAYARVRRKSFVLSHPDLSERDTRLIEMGWVDVGMSKETAIAAWGLPNKIEERHGIFLLHYRPEDQGGTLEIQKGCVRYIVWPPQ